MARALQIPFSLAFPIWVLVVSLLVLIRAGVRSTTTTTRPTAANGHQRTASDRSP